MAITFSRPDPASPASVSSAQFPTARKGYDQSEVRDFLRMVAAEQARLQERERFLERELRAAQQSAAPNMATIDEDTATRLLGEEAARVLTTAREAATQIRQRAEEGSARLLREATDEAQRLREEAEIEAARRRQDAAADSEAELQMAKQQGRDMVNEARSYRERVLSELARRRELARQQIEQLLHGRDRLLQAFERARMAAVDVMAELTPLGEPSEYVNLQPTTGPVPMMVSRREPAAAPAQQPGTAPDLTLVPELDDDDRDGTIALSLAALAAAQQEFDAAAADLEPLDDLAADDADGGSTVEVVEVVDVVVLDVDTAGPVNIAPAAEPDDTVEDAVDEPAFFLDDSATPLDETRSTSVVGDGHPAEIEHGDVTAATEEIGETGQDEVDNVVELFAAGDEPETVEPAPAAPPTATVDDLFARLRAARADSVARAVSGSVTPAADRNPQTDDSTAETSATAETSETADASGERAEVEVAAAPDPDEAVVPIIVAVARKLKRVLADEQNELLDTLRRKEPVRSIDALLPWEADRGDRYAEAVEAELASASVAGAGDESGRDPALVKPACEAVTNEIVAPLRERLTRCIDKAAGNNADLATQVRSLYREWKTHRIDEHVEGIVRLAFDRGALTVSSS